MGMRGFILFVDAIFAALLVLTLFSMLLSFRFPESPQENYYYTALSKDFLEILVQSGTAEELINLSENGMKDYASILFKEFSMKALLPDLQCKLLIEVYRWNGTNFTLKNNFVFYYPGNEPVSTNVYTAKKIMLRKNSSNVEEFVVLTSNLWLSSLNVTIISINTFLDGDMKYPSINFRKNDTVFYRVRAMDAFGNPIKANVSVVILDPNGGDSGKGVQNVLVDGTYQDSFDFEENDAIGAWKIVVYDSSGRLMSVKQINLGE